MGVYEEAMDKLQNVLSRLSRREYRLKTVADLDAAIAEVDKDTGEFSGCEIRIPGQNDSVIVKAPNYSLRRETLRAFLVRWRDEAASHEDGTEQLARQVMEKFADELVEEMAVVNA